jgi:kinetochor protein Mis14/NSL1
VRTGRRVWVSCFSIREGEEELWETWANRLYLDVEYEALDTKLKERVALLEKQKETLTEKVADLRRQVPKQAADGFVERWKKEDEAFDAEMKETDEADVAAGLKVGELKRLDEVKTTWDTGTTGLVGLKTDLTETVAKMERARGVIEEVEGR